MGADNELVQKYSNDNLRNKLREDFNIQDGDFAIVIGEKIDKAKLQTLLLMKDVKNIEKLF